MKPKLKPKRRDLYRFNYTRSVEYKKLYERAQEFLSERKAGQLAFDLMGIDDASEIFRRDVKRFYRALGTAKRDSTDLWDETPWIQSYIIDVRGHMRKLSKILDELANVARSMPPLDKATDYQLTRRTLDPAEAHLKRIIKRDQRSAKKETEGTTKTSSKKKRPPSKKKARKR